MDEDWEVALLGCASRGLRLIPRLAQGTDEVMQPYWTESEANG